MMKSLPSTENKVSVQFTDITLKMISGSWRLKFQELFWWCVTSDIFDDEGVWQRQIFKIKQCPASFKFISSPLFLNVLYSFLHSLCFHLWLWIYFVIGLSSNLHQAGWAASLFFFELAWTTLFDPLTATPSREKKKKKEREREAEKQPSRS